MRTFIIGDIHGCSAALDAILEKLAPDPKEDRLILLDNLFDREPDSRGALQRAKAQAEGSDDRFVLLRGNHEDYLLADRLSWREKRIWDQVGRKTTVASFKAHGEAVEDAVPWLKSHCRLFYVEDSDGREVWQDPSFQCVHAGLHNGPVTATDPHTMLHDHDITPRNHYQGPLTVVGHIALETAAWFAGDSETRKPVGTGEWLPLPRRGALCIDTGCGKGGTLTGMIIEGSRADGYRFRLESVPEA